MSESNLTSLNVNNLIVRFLKSICLVLAILLWGATSASAGQLGDRVAQFPRWESKPPVQVAVGDLVYPDWMAGTWEVTSTLVDMVAPLAPEIVTPGFEGNRRYLNQPVRFLVRFVEERSPKWAGGGIPPLQVRVKARSRGSGKATVVADRAFNGLNIAIAHMGDRSILSVKVDPNDPNRQITLLRGDRQLVSIVTGRGSETLAPDKFVATEVSQQVFRGETQIYLNEVETTTAYQVVQSPGRAIEADQMTAIYLSPQDPDYFEAVGRPVALYRYRLELSQVE